MAKLTVKKLGLKKGKYEVNFILNRVERLSNTNEVDMACSLAAQGLRYCLDTGRTNAIIFNYFKSLKTFELIKIVNKLALQGLTVGEAAGWVNANYWQAAQDWQKVEMAKRHALYARL